MIKKYMFPKKNMPRWIILLLDVFISALALFLAYMIRFDIMADSAIWRVEWHILSKSLGVFFAIRIAVFYAFGIHKGIIRHTSTADFRRLFIAITISSVLFFFVGLIRYYAIDHYYLFPSSVLVIEYLFCVFLATMSRFTIKLWYLETTKSKDEGVRVLIYGAGISGLIAKRTIEKDMRIQFKVVGFLDDNKKLTGSRMEGIPVFHTGNLEEVLKNESIAQVILAIQAPDELNRMRVLKTCLDAGVELKKVPSPTSWINGEFSTKQIAQVKIEDLLGRKAISLNQDGIAASLKDQIILVTGAAGSIGSGIVRQLLSYAPKKVILLDQAESPMYELELELKKHFSNCPIETVIGDVRNDARMRRLFETFQPNWVFHAAAYKHVPLMEENPSEALLTNVKGTYGLVQLALEFNVFKFVMISTDKAVNPTNVMGASKRIAEMIAQKANENGTTQFITTRFGNVLGSNGSVIPLFKRQIEQGGPVTVTDERITRYFMTIPEACQLVLEAGVMGNGGEIFVFDMGESVKIIDLAKNMIRLSGLEEGKDIRIEITGLRPGEKLYEELLNAAENTLPTHHPKILKARERAVTAPVFESIDQLLVEIGSNDNFSLVKCMKDIVPEYISNNSEYSILDK
jgi:FlaA1/EpsC-like NDP-sugar epimerase